MVLRINELKLSPDHTVCDLENAIRKTLRIQDKMLNYDIMRRSIDARKKPELFFVYTIDVVLAHPEAVLKKCRNKKVTLIEKKEYEFPYNNMFRREKKEESPDVERPVVVGSGPAGLFCALMLARAGLRPILLERGEDVDQRTLTVQHFWETGELNEKSNVQFGEGGAGTFSDGKLNTLVKDPEGKIRYVLKQFVEFGAEPEILYHHKPHVGTDVLTGIVKRMREEILRLGGEVHFNACLTGIDRESKAGERYCLEVNGQPESFVTDHLVLAIGHSARDTVQMLYQRGLPMQAKAFAVGLRVQHDQQTIDTAMYGENCPYDLGAAPYKVTHKCGNGRGVYSFCMCPGGYVVNASSQHGMTAVNGMSYSGRDSGYANSAVIVTVNPEDYPSGDPLSGYEFQRKLERAAYESGSGKIPVQRFGDFENGRASDTPGRIRPAVKGEYRMGDLCCILPEEINHCIIEGIHAFGRKIKGFDDPDTLLMGVESRTTSPVRILRDEQYQSVFPGIYPCGEGAGYAGGITSAAADGVRVAEAVCRACVQSLL